MGVVKMHVEISSSARAKMEQILNCLYTRFDLEELMPDELIDALLSLGVDLVSSEDDELSAARDRLIEYCGKTVGLRLDYEETFHEQTDYRG